MGCEFLQMRPPFGVPPDRTPFGASSGATRENLTDDGGRSWSFRSNLISLPRRVVIVILHAVESITALTESGGGGFSLRPPAENVVHFGAMWRKTSFRKKEGSVHQRCEMPTPFSLSRQHLCRLQRMVAVRLRHIEHQ